MLKVSVPSEELKAASQISNAASLSEIRLRTAHVSEKNIDVFYEANTHSDVSMNIDYRAEKKELIDGKSLSALVRVEATLSKNDGSAAVAIMVQYQVIYSLPPMPIPEQLNDKMFDAFARHNGLLNCWPYARERIHSLSNEIGIPMVLPLLKIVAQKKENENTKPETAVESKGS